MPELPDVAIFQRYVEDTSLRRRIEDVEVLDSYVLKEVSPRRLRAALRGRELSSTRRHGKFLFAESDGGEGPWLVLHFGMTGDLLAERDRGSFPRFARVVVRFQEGHRLSFVDVRKLGMVGLTEDPDEFVQARGLGPDALTVGTVDLLAMLERRRGGVKAALMDQRFLAGVGNIFADEILFQSRIHPHAPIGGLNDERRRKLGREVRRVLRTAVEAGADHARFPRGFLTHRRGDDGASCPRCRTTLRRVQAAGRTSWFCPNCQRL